jgi:hypothetical protein
MIDKTRIELEVAMRWYVRSLLDHVTGTFRMQCRAGVVEQAGK